MDDNIEKKVKEIVAMQFGVPEEKVIPDALLADDFGADRLDLVELVIAIEDEFMIIITDQDSERIKTVSDLVKYVESNI